MAMRRGMKLSQKKNLVKVRKAIRPCGAGRSRRVVLRGDDLCMKRVCIIGCGAIGSSSMPRIWRGLRKYGLLSVAKITQGL